MDLSPKDIARYWSKVLVLGPDDCWPWLAGEQQSGHGIFTAKSKFLLAHRVSFFLANGYLPTKQSGIMVLHDCEYSSCQNPRHLVTGDATRNGNYPEARLKITAALLKKHPLRGKRGAECPRFGMKHKPKTIAKLRIAALAREQKNREARMRGHS